MRPFAFFISSEAYSLFHDELKVSVVNVLLVFPSTHHPFFFYDVFKVDNYYDIAASRAYYAAFYSASALLLKENIDTSKHSGVIALIHQHFVKTGKLDKEQGKNLNWLFELRGVGDYGVSVHVASGEAHRAVKVAEIFLDSVNRILE